MSARSVSRSARARKSQYGSFCTFGGDGNGKKLDAMAYDAMGDAKRRLKLNATPAFTRKLTSHQEQQQAKARRELFAKSGGPRQENTSSTGRHESLRQMPSARSSVSTKQRDGSPATVSTSLGGSWSKKSCAKVEWGAGELAVLERGHRVCKLVALKKFDTGYRHLWLNSLTQQVVISKWLHGSQHNKNNEHQLPGPSSSSASGALLSLTNGLLHAKRSNSDVAGGSATAPHNGKAQAVLDVRLVKQVAVLARVWGQMQIGEKWRRDAALQRFDPELVLVIQWGASFVLNYWLVLFDNREATHLWAAGLQHLCAEQAHQPHALVGERWLRKQFYALLPHPTANACVTIKHMKPFVQQRLQCKVASRQLQEITDGGEMGFEAFALAHARLLNFHALFQTMFGEYAAVAAPNLVPFQRFVDFLRDVQHDELGQSRDLCSDFLRHYLRDVDPDRDVPEPHLSTHEFVDYLFAPENSLFDPVNAEVVHDMSRPLCHYWISSSHNTYLTGDQLKSESSLDAYARALLMGCRCIELDCWDGAQKRAAPNGQWVPEIVIYHGYTMTSKLALRDVLLTIRHYAFQTSEYYSILALATFLLPSFPVILSIEDNCSVPAQRQMAVEIKETLGELLLTAPVSRDEWQLPSPAALRRKIILKHKKLQLHSDSDSVLAVPAAADEQQQHLAEEEQGDILSRRCLKKGVLWLHEAAHRQWHRHIFVLFADRLCYLLQRVGDEQLQKGAGTIEPSAKRPLSGRENSVGSGTSQDDSLSGTDELLLAEECSCADAHIAEEWFHGKIDRDEAKRRLLAEHQRQVVATGLLDSGAAADGLFLVRESTTFIGDFTLSFVHAAQVHHCRIKASLGAGGERRYHLLETVRRDTLYELISFYTRHPLDTPRFSTLLQTACPQPQSHLDEPWFDPEADTAHAEELLNAVHKDGAYLVRYSSADRSVFVLSLRAAGRLCHFRLKRDGRIFVVCQRQFESLCQLVEHFQQNAFVHGVCLRYAATQRTIGALQYCMAAEQRQNGGAQMNREQLLALDGCYMEIRDLESQRERLTHALEAFDADPLAPAPLSPLLQVASGAPVAVLRRCVEHPDWLLGRRTEDGAVGWLPARCVHEGQELAAGGTLRAVEELANGGEGDEGEDGAAAMATLNFGTIELAGTQFERCSDAKVCAGRGHAIRIALAQSHWNVGEYVVAADSEEEAHEWLQACQQLAIQANDKIHRLRTREKELRIASELSSLVVYCQAVPFNADFELQDPRNSFYEMCSFSETKHDKLVERGLATFNQRQLSRVYPQASRFTSCNFGPVPMWNSGCHMVALNFQTGDKPMQLNAARFAANGRCGYVLKPRFLMDETFRVPMPHQQSAATNPLAPLTSLPPSSSLQQHSRSQSNGQQQENDCNSSSNGTFCASMEQPMFPSGAPILLSVLVVGGRHLSRTGGYDKGGICSPLVELELLGFAHDAALERTSTITANGLNPVWQERFQFHVRHPEMALLRFLVEDGDFVGPKTDPFIGQATFPLDCVRTGFRSVPLCNQFSEPLELSALLVHVEVRTWNAPPLLPVSCSPMATAAAPVPRRCNSMCALPSAAGQQQQQASPKVTATNALLLDPAAAIGALALQRQSSSLDVVGAPVHNSGVHRMLQAGRSVVASDELAANSAARLGRRTATVASAASTEHRPHQQQHSLLSSMPPSQSISSRSASIESADTINSSASSFRPLLMASGTSSRRAGTNTLRRLFRFGRGN